MLGANARSVLWVGAGLLCACSGCGSHSTFEFDAWDLTPAQDELAEFSLGEYRIPIPFVENRGQGWTAVRHHFQFDFELHTLVSPAEKGRVADAWSRHEGKIRDHVIRICRSATLDELQEPELATLKARLTDALAAHMGEKQVRQLLITDMVSQRL